MFCGNCGNQIDDNANVCPYCGMPTANATTNDNMYYQQTGQKNGFNLETIKEKLTKKNVVIGGIILAVVLIPSIYKSLPSTKVMKYMNNNNYDAAISAYERLYDSGEGDILLNTKLMNLAKKYQNDYIADVVDYDDAYIAVRTIQRMYIDSIKEDISVIMDNIDKLSGEKYSFEEGNKSFNDGDYTNAIYYYSKIPSDSLIYSSVQPKLETAKASVKDQINETLDNYISQNSISSVADYYKYTILPTEDSELSSAAYQKISSYISAKCSDYLTNNDYEGLVDFGDDVDYYFNNSQLNKFVEDAKNSYKTNIMAQAETEFTQGNYEQAASTLAIAIESYGDDPELENKYEEYKAYLPIYLNDFDYFNKDGNIYNNSSYSKLADNTGKSYGRAYSIDGWGRNTYYAEYLLNGKYTNFDGICALAYDERSTSETKFFEVYCDGVLKYTSPVMKAGSMPSAFNIDVTGTKVLKILYPDTNGENKIATIFDGRFYNSAYLNNSTAANAESETTAG